MSGEFRGIVEGGAARDEKTQKRNKSWSFEGGMCRLNEVVRPEPAQ